LIALLNTDRRPLTICAEVITSSPQRIRIIARDRNKPDTVYGDRYQNINGKSKLEIKMPKSPTETELIIYNVASGNQPNGIRIGNDDPTFKCNIYPEALKSCPMFMTQDTISFVKFCQEFCENASILSGDTIIDGKVIPSIYESDNGKFRIHYFDKIRDRKTGQFVSTPARIGHDSGIIEVSKSDFLNYSVPMRMVILLHEYSHVYLSKASNRAKNDEVSADINALMLYFSMGYSEIEAHYAFLKVFKNADTPENRKRYKIINDFIDRYTRGEINNCFIKTNSVTI
jgi:hypothetical protein